MNSRLFYFFFINFSFDLSIARYFAGISLFITLPAAIFAFLLIITGAISEEFEPIKAPSFIIVLCLLLPSKLQVIVPAPILTFLPILLSPI